ncbi:hypothetical protein NEUTE2DRAFT_134744 [Neurospora tetrasperma FGSC 2509]|nr:hypothetical protein NEUTE2DRAFT_134744 [Neurospora tetrasperma FGSC 2509]
MSKQAVFQDIHDEFNSSRPSLITALGPSPGHRVVHYQITEFNEHKDKRPSLRVSIGRELFVAPGTTHLVGSRTTNSSRGVRPSIDRLLWYQGSSNFFADNTQRWFPFLINRYVHYPIETCSSFRCGDGMFLPAHPRADVYNTKIVAGKEHGKRIGSRIPRIGIEALGVENCYERSRRSPTVMQKQIKEDEKQGFNMEIECFTVTGAVDRLITYLYTARPTG